MLSHQPVADGGRHPRIANPSFDVGLRTRAAGQKRTLAIDGFGVG